MRLCVCPRCDGPVLAITARRLQVLELVAQGKEDKEIAAALHIAPSTVRATMKVLYRECGHNSRVRLAVWYVELRAKHPEMFRPQAA